jgi:hypothetical protein
MEHIPPELHPFRITLAKHFSGNPTAHEGYSDSAYNGAG